MEEEEQQERHPQQKEEEQEEEEEEEHLEQERHPQQKEEERPDQRPWANPGHGPIPTTAQQLARGRAAQKEEQEDEAKCH